MKLNTISGAVLAIIGGSACAARSAPSTRPAAVDTHIVGRPLSAAEVAARRDSGTTVDTIVVSPDHLDLQVGQTVMPFAALSFRAVDAKGEIVTGFHPTFILPKSSVFAADGLMLRGVKAGEDSFYVEALPRTTDDRTRPSTSVRVVVHP